MTPSGHEIDLGRRPLMIPRVRRPPVTSSRQEGVGPSEVRYPAEVSFDAPRRPA